MFNCIKVRDSKPVQYVMGDDVVSSALLSIPLTIRYVDWRSINKRLRHLRRKDIDK